MYSAKSWIIQFGPYQPGVQPNSSVLIGISGTFGDSDTDGDVWTWHGTILEAHGEHSDPAWIGKQFSWQSYQSPSFEYKGRVGTYWMGLAFATEVEISNRWLSRYEQYEESN